MEAARSTSDVIVPAADPLAMEPCLQGIRERCTECGACVKHCAFLSRYGTPKAIAANYDFAVPGHQAIAYECSLCGLCTAVCPEGLNPLHIFMESRRLYVDGGNFDATAYKAILGYEKCGSSSWFSWYGIPEQCDTVFFPGCSLPGTRPETTFRMFQDLRKRISTLGVVLDCCTKPSHDLGRQKYFESVFAEMVTYLRCRGVRKILVACPNCFKIFKQYGNGITVHTVYDYLLANGHEGADLNWDREVSVHDPCALRDESHVHQAVRGLLHGLGLKVTEMEHSGHRTICCGEGGMVGFVDAGLAGTWSAIRRQETCGLPMITYCAGCTRLLSRVAPTIHIADLLYRPEAVKDGNFQGARAPFTYLNRLLIKRRLKRDLAIRGCRVGRPARFD